MKKIIPILAITGMLLNPFGLESIVANDSNPITAQGIDTRNSVEYPNLPSNDMFNELHKEADNRRENYVTGGIYDKYHLGVNNSVYRYDSIDNEIVFYTTDDHGNQLKEAITPYRGSGIDINFDSKMARWMNLFKAQANTRHFVKPELFRAYVDAPITEAKNSFGVKNPLLISYAMRKIQQMTLDNHMINKYEHLNHVTDERLDNLIYAIENHEYPDNYQQVYETNPSNDLAIANVLMTIAVQEKTPEYMQGDREGIINKAMDHVNSAINKFEDKDSIFYTKYLKHCYGSDSVQRFEEEFKESLNILFNSTSQSEDAGIAIRKTKYYEYQKIYGF